jgi:hypothetical protein
MAQSFVRACPQSSPEPLVLGFGAARYSAFHHSATVARRLRRFGIPSGSIAINYLVQPEMGFRPAATGTRDPSATTKASADRAAREG